MLCTPPAICGQLHGLGRSHEEQVSLRPLSMQLQLSMALKRGTRDTFTLLPVACFEAGRVTGHARKEARGRAAITEVPELQAGNEGARRWFPNRAQKLLLFTSRMILDMQMVQRVCLKSLKDKPLGMQNNYAISHCTAGKEASMGYTRPKGT